MFVILFSVDIKGVNEFFIKFIFNYCNLLIRLLL